MSLMTKKRQEKVTAFWSWSVVAGGPAPRERRCGGATAPARWSGGPEATPVFTKHALTKPGYGTRNFAVSHLHDDPTRCLN